ncbi:transmembrane domain-containing protein [Patescibacteria group bacterium]|nr:transmembrane domain-containing protein [Patescibacteria group bacterium]
MLRILLGLFLLLPSSFVSAATLYIDPPFPTVSRSDSVTLSVRVDTDEAAGECINAVDAVINYDASIQPVDVSLGDSIFSVWVEAPKINPENRTITFAGGIPNGYCGRIEGDPRLSNIIAKVVFRSPGLQIGGGSDANTARVSFAPETQVFLNDGMGTLAALTTYPSVITLERTPGQTVTDTWRESVANDVTPPQEFSIGLERDTLAFDGNYFIVFSTTDKETGISHYEVMEEPTSEFGSFTWGRADAPWVETRSPYVLQDQSLNSTIRVRALDKAGNEYIATYIPEESQRSLSNEQRIVYAGLAVLVILILSVIGGIWYWIRRRKHHKVETEREVESTDPVITSIQ